MALTTQQQSDIIKYTVGMFGAAPGGYMGSLASYVSAGNSASSMALALADSSAFKGLSFAYSDASTNQQFVDAYAANLLGSTLSAANMTLAKEWMTTQLATMTRGQMMVAAIDAIAAVAADNVDFGAARTQLDNKISVATTYTITNSGSSTDLASLQNTIASVTNDPTTVTTANNTNATSAGQTFTLTTGADTGTGFTGGNGNDLFVGVIGTNGLAANGTTFNPGDNLAGGAGTDTLSLSVSGTNTAAQTTSSVSLSGVEKILVANNETSANGTTIDLSNATGVTTVGLTSSSATGDIEFTNVQNIVAAEMKAGLGDLTVTYAATAVSGTADAQTLTVANQTGGTFTANSIESLTIASGTAANTVTVVGNALTSITVTGDKGLALGALAATVTTLDASGLTAGALTATGGTAVDYSITGGAGNDIITLNGGNYTSADTVAGGAGTDTLSVDVAVAAAADLANVSGVEVLKTDNNVTLAADIEATTIDATAASDSIITLNTGYTNATTIKLTGDATNADKIVNAANVALTITANDADLDAATTVTGGTSTDVINLKATGGVATTTLITGVENINVVAGTVATTDITITMGTNDLQIAAGKTLTVDASALTNTGATLTFNGKADETDGYLNVTGGAGADTITGGASGHDTITGGAGNDSLILATLTANNVVTGGDGTDKLTVTTDIAAASVFAGVTGVESLVLGASTDLTVAATLSATGFTSINAADTSDNIITLSSGYTGDTTVVLTGDATNADKIVNSANVALTITANDADLDANTTVTGGTGTDVINLKATGGTATTTLLTGVDTITVVAGTVATTDITIAMGTNNTQIAAGKTLTVDASALTDTGATLTFTGVANETDGYLKITGGAGADSITGGASGFDTLIGGAGNDSFTFVGIAATNVVTGGDGTDSLTITTDVASASVFGGVTGVESLVLGASTDLTLATTLSATGFTSISAADSSANIITLSSGYTGDTTVILTGDATNADKIVNSANVALTITANDADLDAATTVTGGTGTDVINLKASGGTATTTLITGVENINVVAGTVATDDITITMGTNNLQIAAGKTLTVDASALTNSGATLTFTGQTNEIDGHLVVIGGAGADTITGGAFTDTITGGAGADNITVAAASNKFYYDTITDAATGDILNTADKGTEAFISAMVSLASQATFSDYLDSAANLVDGSANGQYAWFQFSGNTYVVESITNAGGFTAGSDLVVELTGLKDISASVAGDHILTLNVA